MTLEGGAHLTLLVESSRGYANLCRILTAAHAGTRPEGKEHRVLLEPAVALDDGRRAERGPRLPLRLRPRRARAPRPEGAARLAAAFGRERFFVELQRPYERGDSRRHAALRHLAEHLGVETVATGNVHAHTARRTLLQDTLVAIRCRTSLDGCERERRGNREAVLRPPGEMVERFRRIDPAAAGRTGRDRRAARVRPHRRARLPLPRLLRWLRPCDPPACGDLLARVHGALRRVRRPRCARRPAPVSRASSR